MPSQRFWDIRASSEASRQAVAITTICSPGLTVSVTSSISADKEYRRASGRDRELMVRLPALRKTLSPAFLPGHFG